MAGAAAVSTVYSRRGSALTASSTRPMRSCVIAMLRSRAAAFVGPAPSPPEKEEEEDGEHDGEHDGDQDDHRHADGTEGLGVVGHVLA